MFPPPPQGGARDGRLEYSHHGHSSSSLVESGGGGLGSPLAATVAEQVSLDGEAAEELEWGRVLPNLKVCLSISISISLSLFLTLPTYCLCCVSLCVLEASVDAAEHQSLLF